MGRKMFILSIAVLLAGLAVCYKFRSSVKRQYLRYSYYHDSAISPKVRLTKIFSFQWSAANSEVSQQSVAYGEDSFFVVYPSDQGTNVGVIQQYDSNGRKINEYEGIDVGHASSSVYHDGELHILSEKKYSNIQPITVFNLKTKEVRTIDYRMPYKMLWDGLGIENGKLYFLGTNGGGYYNRKGIVSRNQPDSIAVCVYNGAGLEKHYKLGWSPDFHWDVCNGIVVKDNIIYALCNSREQDQLGNPRFVYFTPPDKKIAYIKTIEIPQYIANEMEGGFLKDNQIYVSLHRDGLYRLDLE